MSTHPNLPKIYFHPPPPTSTHQWKGPTTPTQPKYTSTYPDPHPIIHKKCPATPVCPKRTSTHLHLTPLTPTHPWKMYTHSHLSKIYLHTPPSTIKNSAHPQPPKITFTHPHLRKNIKPPYNYPQESIV